MAKYLFYDDKFNFNIIIGTAIVQCSYSLYDYCEG